MELELSKALTFLSWSGSAFLIIIGLLTAKLLFDLSRLTISIKKSADIIQNELNPIMKNVCETTTTINDIVQSANKKVGKISDACDKASDIVVSIMSKVSNVAGFAAKELFKGVFKSIKTLINKN